MFPQAFRGAPQLGPSLACVQPLSEAAFMAQTRRQWDPGLNSVFHVCRGREGPGAGRSQGVSELTDGSHDGLKTWSLGTATVLRSAQATMGRARLSMEVTSPCLQVPPQQPQQR